MTLRTAFVAALLALTVGTAFAQQQTGEIFGKATDDSGAVLPGATVTVSGPALLAAARRRRRRRPAATALPELPIGTYIGDVRTARLQDHPAQDIRITIGFRAQINAELELSSVQETVTVTGESPLVDTTETGTKTTFDLETLQDMPSARDPWVMLEQTPGITMDRANVGGSQSGQQSGYISRGVQHRQQQVVDRRRRHHRHVGHRRLADLLRLRHARRDAGDHGRRGRVAADRRRRHQPGDARAAPTASRARAASWSRTIRSRPTTSPTNCAPRAPARARRSRTSRTTASKSAARSSAARPGTGAATARRTSRSAWSASTRTPRPAVPTARANRDDRHERCASCLETDLTTLNNYNWKLTWAPFESNRFNFQNTWAEKVRNARDASDTRPIETTYRQKAIAATTAPSAGSPARRRSGRPAISTCSATACWSTCSGRTSATTSRSTSTRTRWPTCSRASRPPPARSSRSFQASVFMRPTNSLDVTSQLLPAERARRRPRVQGRLPLAQCPLDQPEPPRWQHRCPLHQRRAELGRPVARRQLDLAPRHAGRSTRRTRYTVKRFTLNLGLRLDIQDDEALAADVAANPILPNILPAVELPGCGCRRDVEGLLAPRGHDLRPDRHGPHGASTARLPPTTARWRPASCRASWRPPARCSCATPGPTPTATASCRPTRSTPPGSSLSRSNAYNPANPSNFLSPGTVDPNIKNDRTASSSSASTTRS